MGGHYYTIQTGSLNYGDWAAGVTYLSRDYQQFLISENVSTVSLLAARGPLATATRIESLPASVTFSATVLPSAVVYLGDIRTMTRWGTVTASTLDNILGTVNVHSTGSGPWVQIDDRASTTGRRWKLGPDGSNDTISGFGTGRLSLIGFKPARVNLLGGMVTTRSRSSAASPGCTSTGAAGSTPSTTRAIPRP